MYPFLNRIKERLEKQEKTLKWLADEVGISPKTINNNPDITQNSLDFILRISALLEFDFLKNYNEWLIENKEQPISMIAEPEGIYQKEQGITVEIKVTATYKTFGLHFADLLDTLRKETGKHGFKIE